MKKLIMLAVLVTLNASAYTSTGNPMANGEYPHVGACAVDKINGVYAKFGTRIILPDGKVLVVKDRFGGSKNNCLDIFLPTEAECWQFGRQWLKCKVEVAE